MPTTPAARSTGQPHRRTRSLIWARLRTVLENQTKLWDRALDDLEPWRREGTLRWRGYRLEGRVLDEGQVPGRR
jgi:hypothetical protein